MRIETEDRIAGIIGFVADWGLRISAVVLMVWAAVYIIRRELFGSY